MCRGAYSIACMASDLAELNAEKTEIYLRKSPADICPW